MLPRAHLADDTHGMPQRAHQTDHAG
jgi:hypothetical protein